MSPDFSVDPAELQSAGACLVDQSSAIGGIRLNAPDVSMFGKLVGSAASDAEPATTQDINALLAALADAVAALGTRTIETCQRYREVEEGNVSLGNGIGQTLGSRQ